MKCPLCKSEKPSLFATINSQRIFFVCPDCDLRFLQPDLRLDEKAEKARYDKHQNNLEDKKYQAFLEPMVHAVAHAIPTGAHGLDFGCGPTPVASHLLQRKGFTMDLYDPFYENSKEELKENYDFIICSEVLEHLYDPFKEIDFLKRSLKKDSILFVMTQVWKNEIPWKDWYYHRDATHVCFYSETSFRWIQKKWAFKKLEIRGENLILLSS